MKGGISNLAFNGRINEILNSLQEAEIKELLERIDLLGNSDIARLLGWSTSKVTNYCNRGILPQPITTIGGRPAWTREQINKFINNGGLK